MSKGYLLSWEFPEDDIASVPIQNSKTSRVKTLNPLRSVYQLNSLTPQFHLVIELCEQIGSTGLYPYAVYDHANRIFEARQFPKSSGYNEDAATGIAAAALASGLLENELIDDSYSPVKVRQGWTMGCPSQINVRFENQDGIVGDCWISGGALLESS